MFTTLSYITYCKCEPRLTSLLFFHPSMQFIACTSTHSPMQIRLTTCHSRYAQLAGLSLWRGLISTLYAVPCWFNLCDEKKKKDVCKFAKRMKKMTGDCNQVENPRMISTKKCKSLISKMVKDETHPLHPYITTLPHGHLRVPWSRTERFRKSFLPYAIKLFNSDWYKLGYKLH